MNGGYDLRVELSLNDVDSKTDRPVDITQLKNDIDYYLKEIYQLRNTRTSIDVQIDEIRTIFKHEEDTMGNKMLNKLLLSLDSLNERLERLEAYVIKKDLIVSELSSRTKTEYWFFDYTDENENASFVNTRRLAEQINNFLDANRVPRNYFLKIMFNTTIVTSDLSALLTQPIEWPYLDEKKKRFYLKMRRFLTDVLQIGDFLKGFKEYESSTVRAFTGKSHNTEVASVVGANAVTVSFLDELQLPVDFIKEIQRFIDINNISPDLFAHSIMSGSTHRQQISLFNKVTSLIERGSGGETLTHAEKLKLTELSCWFNSVDRLDTYEKAKELVLKSNPNYVQQQQQGTLNETMTRVTKKRGRKPKPLSLSQPQVVTFGPSNLNNQELLCSYYRCNTYPNDTEFETIAEKTSNSVNEVKEFYECRHKRFPLFAITRQGYRKLHAFFNHVSKTPKQSQIEELAKSTGISDSYISRWMSRQRIVEAKLCHALQQLDGEQPRSSGQDFDGVTVLQELELEREYDMSAHPDEQTVERLVAELGLTVDQIMNWFKNKRKSSLSDASMRTSDDDE